MKLRKTLLALLLLTITSTLFYACQREDSASADKARLQVYLTDDPGDYEEVVIDVQDIKINYSSDTADGWQSLSNIRTGTFEVGK
jgi:hypothetical protein